MQTNVSGVGGSPYYYSGSAPPTPNVWTNTSISVSSRLTYSTLYGYLNTPAVQQQIADALAGCEPTRRGGCGACLRGIPFYDVVPAARLLTPAVPCPRLPPQPTAA